ncbi:type VI secretion system baseplate subunit TssE [Pseudomonas fulva]|uniref:type VI secretion system baseplate subunit TssE n=1 Tax=Pseudomonas TaxID=286 RepID=UPI0006726A30|nr:MULTISPECIES: type VI secretion system baseplate subunit TssE [Pseudomonas]MBA1208855.1 type VI secretion system baseplate subunit TssE [Pseudomonas fulva]MBA1217968.1 type VI secretion system baseplate subunit TssE [Pseudomonas fulva]MDH0573433.1 type VI secretion system baseplate subunit TssE [Pseudomonas fulva]QDC04017.1 type VI secretion system baseplate subunit TssE [Pseudomonas sp. SWI7]RRW62986.1 type VI secretion system baseplate subunit TssE [Pseudomonas fulva]
MTGFFDRLTADQSMAREASRQERASHKFAAIKRHLETLLNARQGCSQSSPELGLRDFNGHEVSSGDLLKQVSADIRRTIQRFEPRVHVRSLKAMPDCHAPLELHLRLDCHVQVNNRKEQLQLELLVNGHSRHTQVR